MNVRLRHRGWGLEQGGETVEFAMLAGLVFLLLFSMIFLFIGLYDQGAAHHAARIGSREASLFWVDLNTFDEESGLIEDQSICISEVYGQASEFVGRFGLSFSENPLTIKLKTGDGDDFSVITGGSASQVTDSAEPVSLLVEYNHNLPFVKPWSTATGLGVRHVE